MALVAVVNVNAEVPWCPLDDQLTRGSYESSYESKLITGFRDLIPFHPKLGRRRQCPQNEQERETESAGPPPWPTFTHRLGLPRPATSKAGFF
ncbi:hypothetical protein OUZ56_004349 [Daphnia magna]|uniref:Uncharacterized protein n=1 Tax=Daphnia magna TaxID=35525 RepID=A0ABQ9YPH9_9CRUS|nr:hypothetical protein OUZ56_004349 [Daphnia magna]